MEIFNYNKLEFRNFSSDKFMIGFCIWYANVTVFLIISFEFFMISHLLRILKFKFHAILCNLQQLCGGY